jgi:hypothetical protein
MGKAIGVLGLAILRYALGCVSLSPEANHP